MYYLLAHVLSYLVVQIQLNTILLNSLTTATSFSVRSRSLKASLQSNPAEGTLLSASANFISQLFDYTSARAGRSAPTNQHWPHYMTLCTFVGWSVRQIPPATHHWICHQYSLYVSLQHISQFTTSFQFACRLT